MEEHDYEAQRKLDAMKEPQQHIAIAAALPFIPPRTYVFRKVHCPFTLHNVTRCCQCGAKIGRGRDGRKCKTCREVR